MEEKPNKRERKVHNVFLSEPPSSLKEANSNASNDLPTSLANLRQLLLQQSPTDDEIETIKTKIEELTQLTQPTEIFDALQATLKTYITDLLSVTQRLDVLSNYSFQEILSSLINAEAIFDLLSLFANDPNYARTVFNRSFEMLSLPVIKDFLEEKYPTQLFEHVAYAFRIIIHRIQSTAQYITFKKTDLQNQVPSLHLIVEYVDKNKQNLSNAEMNITIDAILTFLWTLVDDTILVPKMVEANLAPLAVKWISMTDISMDIQKPCIHIIHNLARHEQGVQALNSINCINVLKEFKQRVLDPNTTDDDEIYVELRLLYCMVLSLLTEPKENREDLKNLRKVLDQLLQLLVEAGQAENDKCGGFHVSEPLVVLTKLCVHDEILFYVLNESSVKNMQAKSKIEFFCQLLTKFRGALASDNDLDQLTLTALFNMLWSISFHDQYIEELKSDSKFLVTLKSLANDDGETWVDQYVPKHMSPISKAANGILWNLDENNPARLVRTAATVEETKKTSSRMRVMVSYCHADHEFCHQLVDALQKNNHFEVWVDFAYCHTEDFWEEIGEAIEKSHVVLFLMSKDYQDSKSCRQEVMYAKDSLKKRFIPIYTKKDFMATGWLGVRIVGPQYIRFGKKSFDETVKELTKVILDDKKQQEPEPRKETKRTSILPPVIESKPVDNTDTPLSKPMENNQITESELKPSSKPIEKWTKKDINQWFKENRIQQELIDLYDFQYGTDLLLYSQCLRPDWQVEYRDMRGRYEQKHNTPLYRDHFVRFVGAVHRLHPSQSTSKTCIIS